MLKNIRNFKISVLFLANFIFYLFILLFFSGPGAPETPSGSTSTTKSGGSSGQQAADSGHPDSPDVPEVVDTVVGPPPPIDAHLGGGSNEGNGVGDPLGPLPPNWERAYTDKGESYFIGKFSKFIFEGFQALSFEVFSCGHTLWQL